MWVRRWGSRRRTTSLFAACKAGVCTTASPRRHDAREPDVSKPQEEQAKVESSFAHEVKDAVGSGGGAGGGQEQEYNPEDEYDPSDYS